MSILIMRVLVFLNTYYGIYDFECVFWGWFFLNASPMGTDPFTSRHGNREAALSAKTQPWIGSWLLRGTLARIATAEE